MSFTIYTHMKMSFTIYTHMSEQNQVWEYVLSEKRLNDVMLWPSIETEITEGLMNYNRLTGQNIKVK